METSEVCCGGPCAGGAKDKEGEGARRPRPSQDLARSRRAGMPGSQTKLLCPSMRCSLAGPCQAPGLVVRRGGSVDGQQQHTWPRRAGCPSWRRGFGARVKLASARGMSTRLPRPVDSPFQIKADPSSTGPLHLQLTTPLNHLERTRSRWAAVASRPAFRPQAPVHQPARHATAPEALPWRPALKPREGGAWAWQVQRGWARAPRSPHPVDERAWHAPNHLDRDRDGPPRACTGIQINTGPSAASC